MFALINGKIFKIWGFLTAHEIGCRELAEESD
jgi:hypothetical protein